jgi:hypothetical protein
LITMIYNLPISKPHNKIGFNVVDPIDYAIEF